MNLTRPSRLEGREISRRDFLNGAPIAAGGLAVCQSVPLRAAAQSVLQAGTSVCGDAIGDDLRAVRGGNSPSTFNVCALAEGSIRCQQCNLDAGLRRQRGYFPDLERQRTIRCHHCKRRFGRSILRILSTAQTPRPEGSSAQGKSVSGRQHFCIWVHDLAA
jgi:hypothetical protein